MPSRTLQIDAPRLRSRIGNRPILASRAKYFNKKNALAAALRASRIEVRGTRFEDFLPRSSFLGPRTCPRCRGQFHDSFNFDAELKETLNESSGLTGSPAFPHSDIEIEINRLRECDPGSTPWHIGCKLFRRFKQISL
jgi:hypothetical protein